MSQPSNTEITDRLSRQLRGKCVRCPRDAAPGSDYCAGCDDKMKGYRRASAKKRRARRARQGRCRDCGVKSRTRRCARCERRQGARVEQPQNLVEQPRTKIEVRTDGRAPTVRGIGRGRRGPPSREDRMRDGARDLAEAERQLARFRRCYDTALRMGVWGLSRVERDRALRLVAEPGALAVRALAALVLALDPEADTVPSEDGE